MNFDFARTPYGNKDNFGVQRQFQLNLGPVTISGGNDRKVDGQGYHHNNQVSLDTGLGTNVSAQTSTDYSGLPWTFQCYL